MSVNEYECDEFEFDFYLEGMGYHKYEPIDKIKFKNERFENINYDCNYLSINLYNKFKDLKDTSDAAIYEYIDQIFNNHFDFIERIRGEFPYNMFYITDKHNYYLVALGHFLLKKINMDSYKYTPTQKIIFDRLTYIIKSIVKTTKKHIKLMNELLFSPDLHFYKSNICETTRILMKF